jgi:hypothetical protein
LSGIFTYHTGVPMNITTGFADAYPNTSGAGSNRPNYTPNAPNCNGNPYNTTPTASPAGTTLAATGGVYWVNPNCFSATPIGEFGNTPRNFLHGPNFRDLDFSILKNTKITERFNVQFRAEFFNIMNNVNFGQPGEPSSLRYCLRVDQPRASSTSSARHQLRQACLKPASVRVPAR